MEQIDIEVEKIIKSSKMKNYLDSLYIPNKTIWPKREDVFRAFDLCPLSKTRVVIFGQDPYYLPNVADGLAFSTQNKKTPLSLLNIFKEIKSEYPEVRNNSNDLSSWAMQGILLLNSYLTVQEWKPLSCRDLIWEKFIYEIIELINLHKKNVIFVLWGNSAKNYSKLIDKNKHYVLFSAHPSPLSASKGFFGNKHFKKINEILCSLQEEEINWNT